MQADSDRKKVVVGTAALTIENVVEIALGRARVVLDDDVKYAERIRRGADVVAERVARGEMIYGVTTGFGESCDTRVGGSDVHDLAVNISRFHRCGTGLPFDAEDTVAIIVARLASLARGYSGVRMSVLEGLASLVNRRILPRIPQEGSVGASGDLTPLAYVTAALIGEGDVTIDGKSTSASVALREAGLEPLRLFPKEGLALMNGTSAMTGVAALAFRRASRLGRLSAGLTAMAVEAIKGEPRHFDDRIFSLKPHPGQRACARWIRDDLSTKPPARGEDARLQDRYSIRCAPHVIGVLLDALTPIRATIEIELNGVNDNPIVDPDSGEILSGGNFYGGHIAQAMDTMKTCVANVADLLDRQLALMCHPSTNGGLPRDLVMPGGAGRSAHHGFKAMQIAASALTAEALKLTVPASVFSRSTENHNQDKVSLGTIAARDATRVLDLVETVAAIHLLALCQAVDLRERIGSGPRAMALHAAVRETIPANTADRPMDVDIAEVLARLRSGRLPIGEDDFS